MFHPGAREVAFALFDGAASALLPLHVGGRAAIQSQLTDTKVVKSVSVVETYSHVCSLAVVDCSFQTDLPCPCSLKLHVDMTTNQLCRT